MFKLVVLSALLACAFAKPSGLLTPIAYSAPSVAVVHQAPLLSAPLVYSAPALFHASVPSAVSHQSSTVYHGSKPALIAAAPWAAPIAYSGHGIVAHPIALNSW